MHKLLQENSSLEYTSGHDCDYKFLSESSSSSNNKSLIKELKLNFTMINSDEENEI